MTDPNSYDCTRKRTDRSWHSSLDDQLYLLAEAPRRRILAALAVSNPRDREEFEDDEFRADGIDVESFVKQLTHTHLPKLEDAGYLDWDRETDTITRGPRFEEIRPLLVLIDDHRNELPPDWP